MKIFKNILIVTIGWLSFSCTDVIDVDLETAAPKLVIDASIDWEKNTPGNVQQIILSTSTGYYSDSFPAVSGAGVSVMNNASNAVFIFSETIPGTYVCSNFVPVIGDTYTLTVTLNGETYTASEKLLPTPTIESNITQNNAGGITGDEIEFRFAYQDNPLEVNHYMTSVKTNRVAFPEFSLESDEMYQGNQIVEFYSHEDLAPGDQARIKLYGITRRYYDYFNKIMLASGNDGSPFQSTPTTVRGNIINQTDGDNFPLGYFRLSEVDIRDYTVQ